MTQQLYQSIKKLLLLRENVKRLDATGLTSIIENTNNWEKRREREYKNDNLTPIEEIMQLILLSINGNISEIYDGERCKPFLLFYPQRKIGKYRVDFLCYFMPDKQKYIIECDGHDFHEKTKEQVKYDKQRERFFVSNGYKVLRYSGSEIFNDFFKIEEELTSFFEKEYEKED